MNDIQETLDERGKRYGDFSLHAIVAQNLQDVMRCYSVDAGWDKLSAIQKQALTVIADKISRILTGDPDYDDNWRDISGYATLVLQRLPSAKI